MIVPDFFCKTNGEFGLTERTRAIIAKAKERENPNHMEYDVSLVKSKTPWSEK